MKGKKRSNRFSQRMLFRVKHAIPKKFKKKMFVENIFFPHQKQTELYKGAEGKSTQRESLF